MYQLWQRLDHHNIATQRMILLLFIKILNAKVARRQAGKSDTFGYSHHTHAYTIKDCEHLHEYEYQYQEGKAGKGTVGT